MVGLSSCGAAGILEGVHLESIRMPPGFKIQVYAADLEGARSMALSPEGVLVSDDRSGMIHRISYTASP